MKLILTFIFALTYLAYSAEPYDLVKNRQVFEEKKQILTDQYTNWLKGRMKNSNGAEYEAYKKELNLFEKQEEAKVDEPVNKVIDGRKIRIDAREGSYRIGKLKEGDRVQIQYDDGIWTAYPEWAKESPENPKIAQHRLLFVIKDGDIVKVSMPLINTVEKPFEYTVTEESDCYLMIAGNKILSDNDGIVRYRINLIRK